MKIGSLKSKLIELCVGCGACPVVCPQGAISLRNKNGLLSLYVNPKKCNDCGLCVKICPALRAALYKPTVLNMEDIIGHYHKIYVAHASDSRIRWGGASGGVITALILNMLKTDRIDGALVSKMTKPGSVDTYIARKSNEVLEAQGSIYFPTYTARQIKNIRAKDESYAVVGLPCHVTAFKRSEIFFPDLAEKVFIHLGLFCYHLNEFWYLDYFERKIAKMKLEEVLEVGPRRGGWPGSIRIKSTKEEKRIPFFTFWGPLQLLYLTSPIGCLFCCDHLNRLSDLSFGDAWLPSLMKTDTEGNSLIMARTTKGLLMLREAEDNGLITLKETTIKDVLRAQQSIFYKKKIVFATRSMIRKNMSFSPKSYIPLLPFIHAKLARKNSFRNLIYITPESLLGKYAFVFDRLMRAHV